MLALSEIGQGRELASVDPTVKLPVNAWPSRKACNVKRLFVEGDAEIRISSEATATGIASAETFLTRLGERATCRSLVLR